MSRQMLPPGQRAITEFPRFGVPLYARRLPKGPLTSVALRLEGQAGAAAATIPLAELEQLPRKEIVADFHCVTTWSQRALAWSGWSFREVYERCFLPRVPAAAGCAFLELEGLDGYTTCVLLEDLLEANVLLADRLQGEPLSLEHGAPLRLVAPDLYAYKSIKHVCAMRSCSEYRRSRAERQTLAHPRGRVALEERGRGLPGPVYRLLYRALIGPALWYYRRAEQRRQRPADVSG